jgi:hypothetical protein
MIERLRASLVSASSFLLAIIRPDRVWRYRGIHGKVGENTLRSGGAFPEGLEKLRKLEGLERDYESGVTRPVRIAYRTKPATSWMFKRFISSPR